MPNQNECDHIYGVIIGEDDDDSYLYYEASHVLYDAKIMSKFDRQDVFNFCPDCGEKIDWKKIKEELNGND